jgi:hypothetical protein
MADSTGSTILKIGAWGVGLYILLKLLPQILGAFSTAGSSLSSGAYNGRLPVYNGTGWGTPINAQTLPGLVAKYPDEASSLAGLYNNSQGYNYDGSALSPGEQAALTTQYSDPTAGQSIPYVQASGFPDNSYPTFDNGTDPFGGGQDSIGTDPSDPESYFGDDSAYDGSGGY